MRHEIDLYGVMIPGLLACMVPAFFLELALRRLLTRMGFYRHVFHRALFDLALFVVILGGVVQLFSGFSS